MEYVRYRDDLERPSESEAEAIDEIVSAMTREMDGIEREHGRALRATHAKATGLLVGELHVPEGLPDELRQGLFATPGRYAALARFAQGPGEKLADRVSTHRGVGIKVLGVAGPRIEGDDERGTQDFVLEAGRTFPHADAAAFLQASRALARAPALPEAVKAAVSGAARAANAALRAVGVHSRKLDFFGHPPLHPLAEAYFSQAPIRYGDHVAKVGLFPATPDQERLGERGIDASDDGDAFRHAVVAFCRQHAAEFDLRVQLATDLARMPIEDATVEWPEDESPYRTAARLVFPPQDAYGAARRACFEDALTFRPSHGLAAHRPLGSIMRARLKVYGALSRLRHARNGTTAREPASAGEVPD